MRRHSRATATGSGKMMIDLRHEHEIDTAGTWWSAMGQSETNVTTEPRSAVEWIADADLTRASFY